MPTAKAAAAIGATADTLFEIPYAVAPRAVRQRVAETVQATVSPRLEANCTRYFTNQRLFFALVPLGCDADRVYFDQEGLLILTAEGVLKSGLILWPDNESYYTSIRLPGVVPDP